MSSSKSTPKPPPRQAWSEGGGGSRSLWPAPRSLRKDCQEPPSAADPLARWCGEDNPPADPIGQLGCGHRRLRTVKHPSKTLPAVVEDRPHWKPVPVCLALFSVHPFKPRRCLIFIFVPLKMCASRTCRQRDAKEAQLKKTTSLCSHSGRPTVKITDERPSRATRIVNRCACRSFGASPPSSEAFRDTEYRRRSRECRTWKPMLHDTTLANRSPTLRPVVLVEDNKRPPLGFHPPA
jgi:hypothetical protein